MWQHYLQPSTLAEALELLQTHAEARIVAGGSDVLVELSRGVRPTDTLIDITRLAELKYVRQDGDTIRIGALATHNDVIASQACVQGALPLAQACWEVGAPQIRTRATVVGNLVTASPANDTITPLTALGAELLLASAAGERVVPLGEFYPGFRKTALRPGELVREIRVPALRANQRGLFIKLGLRRAQAISVIDLAIVLTFREEPGTENQEPTEASPVLGSQFSVLTIADAVITLGCVAPTIVRAPAAEAFLRGRALDAATCAEAGRLAAGEIKPIDDVRGSAGYRLATVANLVAEGLRRIAENRERDGWPERPILLETSAAGEVRPKHSQRQHAHLQTPSANASAQPPAPKASATSAQRASEITTIATTINGRPYQLGGEAATKSLLDALREDAGLTGTKEGCAEGECGACTVWLNGQAVMACLTPAGQAHGMALTTIEGLASFGRSGIGVGDQGNGADESAPNSQLPTPNSLHPLQAAFIANAAVQCGYCIPGMLMAGAKLLEECERPSVEQIQVALSGNICRCTGYRKIIDAVLSAARSSEL